MKKKNALFILLLLIVPSHFFALEANHTGYSTNYAVAFEEYSVRQDNECLSNFSARYQTRNIVLIEPISDNSFLRLLIEKINLVAQWLVKAIRDGMNRNFDKDNNETVPDGKKNNEIDAGNFVMAFAVKEGMVFFRKDNGEA